ncbi:hypothetical protein FQR65_LT04167 [Abscondita terminalis]|nr:hypothetical protein FQR65_LT04167 [Abscondita terminalis]
MGRKYGKYLCRKPNNRKKFLKKLNKTRWCEVESDKSLFEVVSPVSSLQHCTKTSNSTKVDHGCEDELTNLCSLSNNSASDSSPLTDSVCPYLQDVCGSEDSESGNDSINDTVYEETQTDEDLPDLEVEFEKHQETQFTISGRRIVDINYMFKSLQSIKHEGFGCTIVDLELVSERRIGFRSIFKTKCKMCNKNDFVHSEDPENQTLDVTTAAVAVFLTQFFMPGTIATGGSYTCLMEITSSLNIPIISSATFLKHQNKVYGALTETALNEVIMACNSNYF